LRPVAHWWVGYRGTSGASIMKIRVCDGLFHFISFYEEKMLTGFF